MSAHLLLVYTVYDDRNQRQFVVPDGEFALPDVGLCSAERYTGQLHCRVPLRRPEFLLVTSEKASSTCPIEKGATLPELNRVARGSIRGNASGAAEMGISPVHEVVVSLAYLDWTNRPEKPGICPGTHLTLSNLEPAGRGRIELQFDNFPCPTTGNSF